MNYEIHAIFTAFDGFMVTIKKQSTDTDIGAAAQLFLLEIRATHPHLLESTSILTLQIAEV